MNKIKEVMSLLGKLSAKKRHKGKSKKEISKYYSELGKRGRATPPKKK